MNLQIQFDFQNRFHNYGFNNPNNQLDVENPQLLGKMTGGQTTASFDGSVSDEYYAPPQLLAEEP